MDHWSEIYSALIPKPPEPEGFRYLYDPAGCCGWTMKVRSSDPRYKDILPTPYSRVKNPWYTTNPELARDCREVIPGKLWASGELESILPRIWSLNHPDHPNQMRPTYRYDHEGYSAYYGFGRMPTPIHRDPEHHRHWERGLGEENEDREVKTPCIAVIRLDQLPHCTKWLRDNQLEPRYQFLNHTTGNTLGIFTREK